MDGRLEIHCGDCLEILPTLEAGSVQCCVTSPPYWGLRDYGVNGALGLEATPEEYIETMVAVFREVKRVLRDDGTLWLNMGDSYAANGPGGDRIAGLNRMHFGVSYGKQHDAEKAKLELQKGRKVPLGLKPKDLCMMPARLAIALQAEGWYLRSDIIWHKPNPMPESVTDRPTKAHEMIYLLAKQERYYYDNEAIREPHAEPWRGNGEPENSLGKNQGWDGRGFPIETRCYNPAGRNKRSVWTIPTQPYAEAHFATFPEEIPKLCILAGSKPGDTVLDPFAGRGTTGKVALEIGRKAILIELNPEYVRLIKVYTAVTVGWF